MFLPWRCLAPLGTVQWGLDWGQRRVEELEKDLEQNMDEEQLMEWGGFSLEKKRLRATEQFSKRMEPGAALSVLPGDK